MNDVTPPRAPDRPCAPLRRLSAVQAQYRLREHHRSASSRSIPGDRALERRIEAYIRWNAMAMVVQANRKSSSEYGGHMASYASSATLYEVGFNHFWRAPSDGIPATWCSCRAIPRPASTRAPSSRAA
jgi:hypothetical protein